jgi:hypothetical protein
MKTVLLAMSGLLISAPAAFAGAPVTVPEPSTLAIVAVGVAGALVASRFRNKK